jgi:hypothetical protein
MAVRVAAELVREFRQPVGFVRGEVGEFSVLVDGNVIAQKRLIFFPKLEKIVAAVREALG